jgi:hypothetical protein
VAESAWKAAIQARLRAESKVEAAKTELRFVPPPKPLPPIREEYADSGQRDLDVTARYLQQNRNEQYERAQARVPVAQADLAIAEQAERDARAHYQAASAAVRDLVALEDDERAQAEKQRRGFARELTATWRQRIAQLRKGDGS